MITGHDTVLFVPGPVAERVRAFAAGLAARWPDLRVAVEEVAADGTELGVGPFRPLRDADPLPESAGNVLFARDEAMIAAWDEDGYAPGPDGEGPLMVMYQPCPAPSLRVTALDDPYARGFRFVPHDAVLVGAGLTLVTLVAPDGPFGAALLDELTARLARSS
ncbi:hypothetical protein [Actinomadura rayongensis]|uniref:Uncharacterized protein n=1 Tax=Actinomadura rayongensis TaxID=1429076 RepID=A0A6I4W1J5_9ACTN|nr:hypothetical protein [Actinomadura rayongensis]MXQ63178.1 hypothetical protein [Actinomadura rayongensis]